MTDALQIALSAGFPGCVAIAAAAWLSWRVLFVSLSGAAALVRRVYGRSFVSPILWVLFWSAALYGFSAPLTGFLEDIETRFLNPVYMSGHIGEEDAVEAYEREIRKHTTAAEFDALKRRTAEIAARINSRPIAIYETAWLECSLNPFRVRDDRVAAGWIQFTKAGVSGLGVSMQDVFEYCRSRNISAMMDLTERYLVRAWERAGRPDMANTIDLYLAVFAPAHIGKDAAAVVYQGFSNPAYYKNSGLDGWTVDGGKIVRGRKDGRITVGEIYLCLERKKRL